MIQPENPPRAIINIYNKLIPTKFTKPGIEIVICSIVDTYLFTDDS